jgi:hypothetical protein
MRETPWLDHWYKKGHENEVRRIVDRIKGKPVLTESAIHTMLYGKDFYFRMYLN